MSFRAMVRSVVAASVVASVALLAPAPASAAVGDYGFVDGAYPAGTATPTADKPENKLWYAAGSWYGVLWNGTAFTIQKLNSATNAWSDTGTVVDSRRNSSADTLFRTEAGTGVLYVLSHGVATSSSTTGAGDTTFARYTLSGSAWTLTSGYPAVVSTVTSESASFDIDANGYAFVTFTKAKQPYVAVSTVPVGAAGFAFGTPFVPSPTGVPTAGLTTSSDDISAVSVYQGGKILLLWSNQVDSNVYYAVHVPGDPATTWVGGIAAGGPLWADDHINLASLQNDAQGRLFAVMKTSLGDGAGALPTDPQITLLTFKPVAGTWSRATFGTVADFHTRPIVVADDATNTLYVFATGPSTAGSKVYRGTIYYKSTSLDNPSFAPGLGTPFIRDVAAAAMNNATSTRQSVNGTTGLVVLAANESTLRYWHNVLPLTSTPKPTAAFTVDKTSGVAPLTVKFTDSSAGAPTSWSWNFGDGTAADTTQSPTHVFSAPGTYNVTLTATNAAGSSTSAATTITVTAAPVAPVANFAVSANPTAGTPVTFTDTSTNTPTTWTWNFGDGTGTVTTQNAAHTFATPGTYNVTLTASNAGGPGTITKAVTVAAPQPPASGVLYRVNAGGSVAVAGTPAWSTDTTAAPSPYSNVTAARSAVSENLTKVITMTDPSVPAGTPQSLFQSHRKDVSGGDTMRWAFPATKAGTYTVKLYFAETWSQYYVVGGRVFTVQAEGANVLPNWDTFAAVGKLKGVVKTVTVNVTDGTLNLNFARVAGDPFVSAIEVSGPA